MKLIKRFLDWDLRHQPLKVVTITQKERHLHAQRRKNYLAAFASTLLFDVMKQLICRISQKPLPSSRQRLERNTYIQCARSQPAVPLGPIKPRLEPVGLISLPVWCLATLLLSHHKRALIDSDNMVRQDNGKRINHPLVLQI